jgi:hypothetical protein
MTPLRLKRAVGVHRWVWLSSQADEALPEEAERAAQKAEQDLLEASRAR